MTAKSTPQPRTPTKPRKVAVSHALGPNRVQEQGLAYSSDSPNGLVFHWMKEIESLIERIEQPALFHRTEGHHELLADLGFFLEVERGILYCGMHVGKRTLRKRIIEIQALGHNAIELKTSRLNVTESFIICSARQTPGTQIPRQLRGDFQKCIEAVILRNFPNAKIQRSTLFSDLSHSLSGKYVRLHFSSGLTQWTALAVSSWEGQSTIDGILSCGIIWRDHLVNHATAWAGRLVLIVPVGHSLVLKSRLGLIRGAGHEIHLMEMDLSKGALEFQDLTDSGNIDTALTMMHSLDPRPSFTQTEKYQRIMNLSPGRIQPIFRAAANVVSFRIHGLEFAQLRLSERSEGEIFYGVGRTELLSDWKQLARLVAHILEKRQARASNHNHELYHLQSERWLESLALEDIQRIDGRLSPSYIYPQVPAFLAGDRGMIDILAVTLQGRLAVLELKVSEDIELPLQGLDYWTRVHWHQLRGEFIRKNYFRGLELSWESPILYFVCPQFCYHSTFPQILARFESSVPMVQVGINENWREGIQVVMRREWNRPY